MLCHWRDFAEPFAELREDECVLISPRLARRSRTNPPFLPYFNVRTEYRQFIWEQLTETEMPAYAVLRHHCIHKSREHIDSRGLCVNPLHQSLGSQSQNTADAREEQQLRQQLGYWEPDASAEQRIVADMYFARPAANVMPLLYQPTRLPEAVVAAYRACKHAPIARDQELLASARAFLRAARYNQGAPEALSALMAKLPAPRLHRFVPCQWHANGCREMIE